MNRINHKVTCLLCCGLLLVGCASKEDDSVDMAIFNNDLYDGKPMSSSSDNSPPMSEEEAIMRGDSALLRNNLDVALYEYIRSIGFPEAEHQAKTLYAIGQIHQARNNLPLAQKAYQQSLNYDDSYIDSFSQLGVIYSKQGLVTQAKSYFYKALNADLARLNYANLPINDSSLNTTMITELTIDPQSPYIGYLGLGIIYDLEEKHAIAQALYQRSLDIKPDAVNTLISFGYSRYMSKSYSKAEALTRQALKLDSDNEKAINNMALIYLAQGMNARALNIFMQQMDESKALNNVGYFLLINDKPAEAVTYFQQAIDKEPAYYKVANDNLSRALAVMRAEGM
jgi:Tfp pilus assembly protein PilF